MERKPETLRVDSYSGIHRDQTGALPTDSGADPARLYRSQNSETKGQLIRGHYTRIKAQAARWDIYLVHSRTTRAERRPIIEHLRNEPLPELTTPPRTKVKEFKPNDFG